MQSDRQMSSDAEKDISSTGLGLAKKFLLPKLAALAAGLVAALVSVVCMFVLRLAAGVPTPVELFGNFVLKKLPFACSG